MNNDLSSWEKIMMVLQPQRAKNDAQIRYVMGDRAQPGIPMDVLRDTYKGAEIRSHNTSDLSFYDLLDQAMRTREQYRNIPQRGMQMSPTGADMFDLWNPDLRVPEKATMPNFWGQEPLTFGEYSGA